MTRARVFAQLRSNGMTQLGKVRRLCLETSGSFTLVPANPARPGLSVLPDWDGEFVSKQKPVPQNPVCSHCGMQRREGEHNGRCRNCGNLTWVPAIE